MNTCIKKNRDNIELSYNVAVHLHLGRGEMSRPEEILLEILATLLFSNALHTHNYSFNGLPIIFTICSIMHTQRPKQIIDD